MKDGQFKSLKVFEAADVSDVAGVLKTFYGGTRKTDGQFYAPKFLTTTDFGLQKHFIKTRTEDIINDARYDRTNR